MAQADIPKLVDTFIKQHYTPDFGCNRAAIQKYYHPQAMLTFEDENHVGSVAIQAKLTSLPFQEMRHDIKNTNIRVQPSVTDGFVIVLITGHFEASELDRILGYSRVFQLKVPDTAQAKDFLICNDIYLLSY
uniref:NTF2-related export protein n=1 Tax=Bionectria ochroleuca TaxID=29856 RepID=A0A8H7NF75_BIOOC